MQMGSNLALHRAVAGVLCVSTLCVSTLCGALCVSLISISPARAQGGAPKSDPQAAALAKLEKIGAGELRLDGKITAILGDGVWQMEASSWVSPRGVSTDFEEPKSKAISVAPTANIHPRGELEKVPLREVKLSSRVAIIGKNGPNGTLVAREVILLEGYGSHRTVGTINSHPLTSVLVKQSRDARDAGQLPKALAFIERAIITARGLGDSGGEGLASQDKALLLMDLDQPKEAFVAFQRVESLGRTLDNPLLLSLGLSGTGSLLRANGQIEKAIAAFKEGDTVSANSEASLHLGLLSDLATTYLLAGQLQNGIGTLNRIHPLEQAAGKDGDAGETLLTIAALTATENAAGARQTLQDVQTRLDRARDEKIKAALVGGAALVRWRLGEKDAARTGFTEAAALLQGTGASGAAKKWEGMAERLEGAGESWQDFFLSSNGFTRTRPKAETAPETTPEGAITEGAEAAPETPDAKPMAQ